jgi:translation initiation factor IF-3
MSLIVQRQNFNGGIDLDRMANKYHGKAPERKFSERVDEYIKWSPVRVIRDDGVNLGIIPTDIARKMARELGLNLVEVSPDARPPVCRIMDYSKFRYEKSIKEKEAKAKQRKQPEMKGMWFSSTIGTADLETKLARVMEFLGDGHKVQIEVRFNRGALAHKEVGFQLAKTLVEKLQDTATVLMPPRMEGKRIRFMMAPATVKA